MPAKISRIELGQSGVRLGDLRLLLDFYGADAEQVDWLVERRPTSGTGCGSWPPSSGRAAQHPE
ncbi:hypothetical protein GCM10009609_55730 [Pseudonocardia aurantiaca]